MTTRNFRYLFEPRSVALVGASRRPGSVGAVIARNLLRSGFDGPVLPVNPRYESVEGVLAYPDVESLPLVPDLAVIATPADQVAGIVGALAERGTRAAVVISAGFGEGSSEAGARHQRALLEAARPSLLRLVGPNTIGILAPRRGLNASFAHLSPQPGHLAFVTQSGAVVTSVIDWAQPRGIGFSHLVSLGGMLDVDFGDMLDYLASDDDTHAILVHIEGITHARKFMSAARAAARTKPVLVVKSGRMPGSAKAAASHTGALAGADEVYETAFRRAGMLRVADLESLFAAVETLADAPPPQGPRLGIVTNGGGLGVMAADELLRQGGRLAELSDECIAELDRVLPATWSKQNPVDIVGDAPPHRTADAMEVMLRHPDDMDGLLVINCPTAVASPEACAAAAVERLAGRRPEMPVLTSWVGEASAAAGRRLLNEHGFATYESPGQAVRAFMQLVDYRRRQEILRQVPPSVPEQFEPDRAAARRIVDAAFSGAAALRGAAALGDAGASSGGEVWLGEAQAKSLLAAYGVPVTATRIAASAEEAGALAKEFGVPVALKIASPDILHKSDVGGVMLNLQGAAAVTEAARRMQERLAATLPDADLQGFTVQPMADRPGAFELIVGASVDPQFGPVLLFGQGGTAVELIRDRALELPPLNMRLARSLMERTRIHALLQGYRDRPAVDLEALALTLVRISQLVIDVPEVAALDINPLLADEHGVLALDARIQLAPAETRRPLAIRPYPRELEQTLELPDGTRTFLRPVLPEDEPALQSAFRSHDPEAEVVPEPMRRQILAARFTQIDFDRELGLVATEPGTPGTTPVHGAARLLSDPDHVRGEVTALVRPEWRGRGLGTALLDYLVRHARERGLSEVWGAGARSDVALREMCRTLGFEEHDDPEDPAMVRYVLGLQEG